MFEKQRNNKLEIQEDDYLPARAMGGNASYAQLASSWIDQV